MAIHAFAPAASQASSTPTISPISQSRDVTPAAIAEGDAPEVVREIGVLDFSYWTELRSGPDGQPELLAEVVDDKLVQEAMRLQRERHFDQGDIWRVFCNADPERALRGLRADADAGRWEVEAWRALLWAANDKGDDAFQFAVGELMLRMPEGALRDVFPAATSWLQKRREILSSFGQPGGPLFIRLWDRFADSAYDNAPTQDEPSEGRDLMTEALNHPGGVLAWSLVDALGARSPGRSQRVFVVRCPGCGRVSTYSLDYDTIRDGEPDHRTASARSPF